jgi:hypothetical protein
VAAWEYALRAQAAATNANPPAINLDRSHILNFLRKKMRSVSR